MQTFDLFTVYGRHLPSSRHFNYDSSGHIVSHSVLAVTSLKSTFSSKEISRKYGILFPSLGICHSGCMKGLLPSAMAQEKLVKLLINK